MPPLSLTDDQLAIVQRLAEPLHPRDRGAYLKIVAELLNGHELGDGVISRAAREAQQRFLRAPGLSGVEPHRQRISSGGKYE